MLGENTICRHAVHTMRPTFIFNKGLSIQRERNSSVLTNMKFAQFYNCATAVSVTAYLLSRGSCCSLCSFFIFCVENKAHNVPVVKHNLRRTG